MWNLSALPFRGTTCKPLRIFSIFYSEGSAIWYFNHVLVLQKLGQFREKTFPYQACTEYKIAKICAHGSLQGWFLFYHHKLCHRSEEFEEISRCSPPVKDLLLGFSDWKNVHLNSKICRPFVTSLGCRLKNVRVNIFSAILPPFSLSLFSHAAFCWFSCLSCLILVIASEPSQPSGRPF